MNDAQPEGLVAELAALSVELAEAAGRLAYDGRRRDFEIATKSTSTDLVTEIDTAVERWIIEQLTRRRPGDGVLAEEGDNLSTRTGVRWIVDPIDGTVNFALGLPHYAVSVAAELDGDVVAGCVHNPETGETYRAVRGAGAHVDHWVRGESNQSSEAPRFRRTERLGARRLVPLDRAVVATGFGYDSAVRARQVAVVARILPHIGDIRRAGAASLDLCAVAAGRVDGYFEAGLHPWDLAAGLLIAQEAGCVSSGLRGRPADGALVAVSGASLAGALTRLLETVGADQVL
ncbi:MAG: inositol monophosphatase [Actinobacteria bacterium]|nr:inositol monophosphatase [Actinomycetota bacterium]